MPVFGGCGQTNNALFKGDIRLPHLMKGEGCEPSMKLPKAGNHLERPEKGIPCLPDLSKIDTMTVTLYFDNNHAVKHLAIHPSFIKSMMGVRDA